MTTNCLDSKTRYSTRQAAGWRRRADRRRSAICSALTGAVILLLSASAAAIQITGSLTDVADRVPGQNLWRATYTVSDWSGYAAGTGFSIEVPLWGTGHGMVDAASGGGAGWQVVALQRDPDLPATGRLDARSTSFSPSLSSPFHLDFVWNGPGAAPALPNFYRVYNSSYATIESGIVFAPEPGTSACAIAALVALSLLARRRRSEAPIRRSQPRFIGLILSGTLMAGSAWASTAGVDHFTSSGNYDIRFMVATDLGNRINQTQIEYPVVVTVTNRGSDSRDFTLSVSGGSSYTQVLQSTLDFTGLAFNQSQTSQTLILRHNRQYAFDPGALGWLIEYPATIVRIINDLESRNGWDEFNAILWLRVGPTEASVGGPPPNSYEKLHPWNTHSSIGDQLSADYNGGSYRDYDVSSLSPNYWILAQAGWWDYVVPPFGGFAYWEKNATNVRNCSGQWGTANMWTTIRVTGHQSGIHEVYLSNFLPSYGTWQGMPACQ